MNLPDGIERNPFWTVELVLPPLLTSVTFEIGRLQLNVTLEADAGLDAGGVGEGEHPAKAAIRPISTGHIKRSLLRPINTANDWCPPAVTARAYR